MTKKLMDKLAEAFNPSKKTYYSFSRSEYYTRHIFPLDISLFRGFWGEETEYISKIPIQFRNLPFLISNEDILNIMGEPRYKHKFLIENHTYRVYFYKKIIVDRTVIIQLHLIDNKLFSACYTYTKHPLGGLKAVTKAVTEKYISPQNIPSGEKVHIKDTSGNSINVIDNININIFYLSGDEDIKFLVSNLSQKMQNNKVAIEELAMSQMLAHF
jgi:hypothetical protein